MALRIPRELYDQLRQHGEATYPHECCGVLVGEFVEAGGKAVKAAVQCGNTRTDSLANRYHIVRRNWCAFSVRRCWPARTLWASITRIPTILRNGPRPILPKRIGPDVRMSLPALKRGTPC